MRGDKKSVLLVAMPFAGTNIPSIQLAILKGYLKERDVDIKTSDSYLKAAEFYGINNYNFLIYPPNDSYLAQMAFSKYLFPTHWTNTKEKFKEYYNEKMLRNNEFQKKNAFEDYVQKTDMFYKWFLKNVGWGNYDIIGFTLNYGQFLPSLAVANKIKEINSEKIIVFGGSRTVGNLGIRVLEAFDFVDFIVSGDGEEALYSLASNYQNKESIHGLIFRKGQEIIWNETKNNINLNDLSIPSYDNFYKEISSTSSDVQEYFHYFGYLPIEISRGCWWNKCSFCNLNLQHQKYREKSSDKIVEEIQILSEKYKILNFQFIGNTLPASNYNDLFNKIIALNKDFNIVVEARAGKLKSDDYTLLKQAGFTNIQTGIESFSSSYLKKMNKGVHVIDNIAALKFCKENGIKNNYNLVVNYPNEEPVDYDETKNNVQLFKQYLDPPHICNLRIVYGSPIQCSPEYYNIESLKSIAIDQIMFPQDFLEKKFNFIFDFKQKVPLKENNWGLLINTWAKEREKLSVEGAKTGRDIDKFIFYFIDGGKFIKIYDKRNVEKIQVYVLNTLERAVFLLCTDVISFGELKKKMIEISESNLFNILKSFEECGIVFREDDCYLSLPLNYKKCVGKKQQNEMLNVDLQLITCLK